MHWVILILGICSNALASVFIKVAVSEPRKLINFTDPISILTNWPFLGGLFLYVVSLLFYSISLTKLPLNVAHPVLTTGAVAMVAFMSVVIFKEYFNWLNALGIVFVMVGVALIAVRGI